MTLILTVTFTTLSQTLTDVTFGIW